MILEHSLKLKAINTPKSLGVYRGCDEGSMSVESQKSRRFIPVEILFPTTITSVPPIKYGMSGGLTQSIQHPVTDIPVLWEAGDVMVSAKDINRNEISTYFKPAVFDELQKLRKDKTKFSAALQDLRSRVDIHERVSIVHRLETLMEDFQDDYGRALDADSLRTFIDFLSQYPKLKKPSITANENGILFAEWKNEDGRRSLGVLNLPMHQVRFAAFRPDASSSIRKKHISGVSSIEHLFLDLAPYDILAWVCVA
ncbi:MAG: hypothetical protein Q8R84_03520 [Candidatus Nitrotoga sp.]|nr:hypothetical protein [Candidatus Nitrotoga sp.]